LDGEGDAETIGLLVDDGLGLMLGVVETDDDLEGLGLDDGDGLSLGVDDGLGGAATQNRPNPHPLNDAHVAPGVQQLVVKTGVTPGALEQRDHKGAHAGVGDRDGFEDDEGVTHGDGIRDGDGDAA
jgi:hypothetical protein